MKYIFWTTSWGILLIALNAIVFYSFISENYEVFVELNDITDEAKTVLFQELDRIVLLLSSVSILFLLLVSVLGIFLSHKIAGPMYKFKKTFIAIKNGSLDERIYLRPKDQFKDVAFEFNEMMNEITSKNDTKS